MNRRLCGYQVRIKINAFRWRGRSQLLLPAKPPAVVSASSDAETPQYPVRPEDSKIFSPHTLACTAEAKQILEASLSHHYTLPALARKVGLNVSSLQACFKQQYGTTIFGYGQDLRLEQGKKLLRETNQTIQEIAEACGYPEQANFTSAFKRKYGVAPGRWRKGRTKY